MKKKLMKTAAISGLLFSLWAGPASAATHHVQSGDTLWKLSTKYKVTVNQLMEWNSLKSATIYVGQPLIVSPNTTSASGSYTVKAGDTLWKIANSHKISVSQLKSMNSLSSDTIYVGQVLKLSQTSTQANTQASQVDTLITESKKYIGTPYVYGGTTPSGFDCSGYLGYVYKKVGITLPRTVASMWSSMNAVSTLKVGDIVFFNTSGSGPSHAGIYLGGNQFIHAGTSTGVTISDMTSSYWKSKYLGAKTAF